MSNIQDLMFSAIENKASPLWFPALTKQLVRYGWKDIYEKYGLHKENYSTETALHGDIGNSITVTACLSPTARNSAEALQPINIYPMPDEIASTYADSGSKPYSPEMLQNSTVLQCLQESLDILAAIPTVYETVSTLVACLHILQPEDDDFDISYSLPNIPFSIFVSVPSKRMENDVLRVAEAILHEAMHLQLTLIEQFVPMIVETDEKYFSPWKNEYRHPRGVLHAIYVFRVIKQFFELLIKQNISSLSIQYLSKRCDVISRQLAEINDFVTCLYFTEAGNALINRLLFVDE
jgi:hypothetical protein